jgi:hypothetical protein
MEIQQEDQLTPLQKAKSKYYQKNKVKIIQQINEMHKNKYHTDEDFRQSILKWKKAYYQANKDKKKEYYLKRKQAKQQQQQ